MQKWILLILINLLVFQAQAQQKKRINFYELDVIRGLYFQPNTIKPYSGTAFDKFPNGKKRMEMPIKEGKIHGVSKEWSDKGKKFWKEILRWAFQMEKKRNGTPKVKNKWN